ncbi:MAG: histidine phosphatase family protein, partial [Ornithinimicrobium sp.]
NEGNAPHGHHDQEGNAGSEGSEGSEDDDHDDSNSEGSKSDATGNSAESVTEPICPTPETATSTEQATKVSTPTPGTKPTFGDARVPVSVATSAISSHPPAMSDPVRIILVRHGVTDFTLASKLDGRGGADPELHAHGHAQAAAAAGAVAKRLEHTQGPVQVLTSSLRRARQTGGAIAEALGVQPDQDADWDEQNFGDWDGAALRDLASTAYDDLLALRADVDYARPGGESHRQLSARVEVAFARAIESRGTVVVATHRKPLMCVLAYVLQIDHERMWSVATAPCSLTEVEVWPDGGVSVSYVNDTHHLQGTDEAT